MGSNEENVTSQTEVLQLKHDTTDGWVEPFTCNHVVVNFTQPKLKVKKKAGILSKKGINGGKEKEFVEEVESQSFCVMCGEVVADAADSRGTVDDITSARESNIVSKQKQPGAGESRRKLFRLKSSSSGMSASQIASTDKRSCLMHSHKKVKYFCEDHQEVCCSVCVNVLHRGCTRIMLITDEIQSGWDARVCEDTVKALHAITNSFQQIISHNETAQAKLHEQVAEFKTRREYLRTKITQLLDDFDRTSEKLVKKFVKVSELDIKTTIDTCKDVVNDIEACSSLLEDALTSSSDKETFIVTQKVLKQKSKYAVALSDAVKHSKELSIAFVPASVDSIEDVERLGEVEFCAEEVKFPVNVIAAVSKLPLSDLRSPRNMLDAFARSESVSSLDSQMTFHGKFNVRLTEDKNPCEIVGATFLSDDKIALVDMKNRKLKVFDSRFSKGNAVELTSEPRAVAVISPMEVAVTLPDESRIQFISTGKRLCASRSILTSLPCYGIRCHNQELVVLCDDGFKTTAITTLDFGGKELRTMKMNSTGKVILKNPWDIAVNLDGQHICVTDRGRLLCVDSEGATVFQYIDEELQNARGLAADDLGRYYVCGTGSGNVHQVSPAGKKLAIVLNENDVPSPQAVCYQPTKRLLLLSSVAGDHVYLYKLAKQ